MTSLPRTLPASWFCSLPLYQLERRAIFLKSWHLLGPVTRFKSRNEKVIYEIAQVTIIVENLVANSELRQDTEDAIVVYAQDGRKILSRITSSGLVFATLSTDAPSFEEFFPGLDSLIDRVDFRKLPHRRSITYEGNFNWKTMMDGYQECMHCIFTHPTFSKYYPPTFYSVTNHGNFSRHIADPNKPNDGLFLYFFPICTLNVYGGGMTSFRSLPTKVPGITRMEFDYYFQGSDCEFEEYFKFVRQVALEDYELCEKAQHNLEMGVYGEGILNPVKENGVVGYQGRVRELVKAQYEIERKVLDGSTELQAY